MDQGPILSKYELCCDLVCISCLYGVFTEAFFEKSSNGGQSVTYLRGKDALGQRSKEGKEGRRDANRKQCPAHACGCHSSYEYSIRTLADCAYSQTGVGTVLAWIQRLQRRSEVQLKSALLVRLPITCFCPLSAFFSITQALSNPILI